jgi:hypothetical protein
MGCSYFGGSVRKLTQENLNYPSFQSFNQYILFFPEFATLGPVKFASPQPTAAH